MSSLLLQDPETPSAGIAPNDLHPAASELGARADARTAELDAGRRLPDDLHLAAVRAGLFRQLVSPELGGPGTPPLNWFRTGLELARHEASFGWVVTQGAAELGWIGAGADDTWAREVLADPVATSASTIAGIGSLRLDGPTGVFGGRWGFNTGCQGATWIGGLALVDGAADEEGRPVTRWAWVPADRAAVVEDWDPDGLRGTGSHTTVVPEQEIPTAWTFSPEAPTSNDRGAHRALVGNGNWPIATSVEHELEGLWADARRDGEVSPSRRVALHRANLAANRLAGRVVDLATDLAGTTAVARTHVLSRCRRDAHALKAHISVNGAAAELNTRVALGLTDAHVLV